MADTGRTLGAVEHLIDKAAVLAANRAFYEAFEALDLDAMSDLWDHDEHIFCTHPGWPTLRGWPAVSASWFTLFTNGQNLQFIITDESVVVNGETAWVSCDENLLGAHTAVASLNLFALVGGRWHIVGHHGSPIAPR